MNSRNPLVKHFTFLLIIFIVIAGFTNINIVQADDYYKIKLKINVVSPSGMNDTAIKDNIDRVNEIFADCRIKFNAIIIEHDVSGSAINESQKGLLLGKMKDDLKAKPFEGSGGGITVTDDIDGPGSNTNGETYVGDPTTVLVEDGTDGETWAHELAHGLGASHNGKDKDGDGDNDEWDPDGDGTPSTAQDKDNMVWPFKNTRTGTEFTEDQCEKMRETAKKYGQGVLNAAQTAAAADNDSWIGKIFDYFVDTVNDTLGKVGDLIFGSMISLEPFTNLTIEWNLNDIIPVNDSLDLYFHIGIDSDNNQSTGSVTDFGGLIGVDKIFTVQFFNGNLTNADRFSYVTYMMTEGGGDIPAIIDTGYRTVSRSSFNTISDLNETAVGTYVKATIDWSDLGVIDPEVPAVAVVENFANADYSIDAVNFTLHSKPLPTPRITVDQMQTWNGQEINIIGENFAPGSTARITINEFYDKFITIDVSGKFDVNLLVENMQIGVYYLEVLDDQNNLAVAIIEIILSPTISSTTTSTSSMIPISSSTPDSTAITSSKSSTTEEDSSDDGINFPFIIFLSTFVGVPIFINKIKKKQK